MPSDLRRRLSANFSLGELIYSSTAERDPSLKAVQHSPPSEAVDRLEYLCKKTLQPLRDSLGFPIELTSGYRCRELNRKVGGSAASQHILGEAADCKLSPRFLTDPGSEEARRRIREAIGSETGLEVRPDVNSNFYLFALAALELEEFDVDQVIHEHGEGPGEPAWVHISASKRKNRREIVVLGPYARAEDRKPDLGGALRLGTSEIRGAAAAEGEGSMQQDPANPARFNTEEGTGVQIEVTAVGTGVFATPSPPAQEVSDGVFAFVASGAPGYRERIVIGFQFMEKHDPPASYEVRVTGGGETFEAPTVYQPLRGTFPKTVDYVLTFVITG